MMFKRFIEKSEQLISARVSAEHREWEKKIGMAYKKGSEQGYRTGYTEGLADASRALKGLVRRADA